MNAASAEYPDNDKFLVGDVIAFGDLRGTVVAVAGDRITVFCNGKAYKVHSANHKLRKWPPRR